MEHEINRTDVMLMQTLDSNNALSAVYGLTIDEIVLSINEIGNAKSRMTIYRRLRKLVSNGYVAKGVTDVHADTFYLLEKGRLFLGKDESK